MTLKLYAAALLIYLAPNCPFNTS